MVYNTTAGKVIKDLWALIQDSLAKYNVVFTRKFPNQEVESPVIVWSIYRRVPYKEGATIRPDFTRYERHDDPSKIDTVYEQRYSITYQFDIFGSDEEALDNLATEFEFLITEASDVLKETLKKFEFSFTEELTPLGDARYAGSDLIRKTLRFGSYLTVETVKTEFMITQVQETIIGASKLLSVVFTRLNSDDLWELATGDEIVYGVDSVTLTRNGTVLTKDVDYSIVMENDKTYLKWISNGLNPTVNEKFKVTYSLLQRLKDSIIS